MIRVRRVILGALVLATLMVAAGGCSSGGDDHDSGIQFTGADPAETTEPSDLAGCGEVADDDAARDCYAEALSALFEGEDDPSSALEEAAVAAYSDPTGRLLGDCHGLMHTVGREFAAEHDVTLASLMTFLPQSNEPGCTAGFAHGLVTGVAPQIDLSRPAEAAAVCDETDTRYQRYSCIHGFGHAFMRLVREDLDAALQLCAALGDVNAPDCSQGAFHDYWFAVIGADDTEPPEEVADDPRELCGAQDPQFVRPCWYRAFVDDRPDQPVDGVGSHRGALHGPRQASSGRRASRRRPSSGLRTRAPSSRSAPISRVRTPSAASAAPRCRTSSRLQRRKISSR